MRGGSSGSSARATYALTSPAPSYLDPTMAEAEGNRSLLVYVEDLDEPGTGTDGFWIQISEKNRRRVSVVSSLSVGVAIPGGCERASRLGGIDW